jgi:RNA polymerase-interacting CarD/CdnL/TRCF family regulator
MPQRDTKKMKRKNVSELVSLVTDLDKADKSLSPEERKAYKDAQRSVVDARYRAEMHQGQIRVL